MQSQPITNCGNESRRTPLTGGRQRSALLDCGDTTRSTLGTATDFKRGIRKLASGVNVITVCDGRISDSLTAIAGCCYRPESPHLLVCVNTAANAREP